MARLFNKMWSGRFRPDTIDGAVAQCVEDYDPYSGGALEALETQMENVAKIIGVIVAALPEDVQDRIAEELDLEEVRDD